MNNSLQLCDNLNYFVDSSYPLWAVVNRAIIHPSINIIIHAQHPLMIQLQNTKIEMTAEGAFPFPQQKAAKLFTIFETHVLDMCGCICRTQMLFAVCLLPSAITDP